MYAGFCASGILNTSDGDGDAIALWDPVAGGPGMDVPSRLEVRGWLISIARSTVAFRRARALEKGKQLFKVGLRMSRGKLYMLSSLAQEAQSSIRGMTARIYHARLNAVCRLQVRHQECR